MIRTQVLKHFPEARESEREGSKGDVRKEQWRRVGMSGSLRGRRPEEMTQLNAFPHLVRSIF